jgi:hypothetical protein
MNLVDEVGTGSITDLVITFHLALITNNIYKEEAHTFNLRLQEASNLCVVPSNVRIGQATSP